MCGLVFIVEYIFACFKALYISHRGTWKNHVCCCDKSYIQKIVLYENGNIEGGEPISLNSEDCSPYTDFSRILLNKSAKINGRSGYVRLHNVFSIATHDYSDVQ